MPKRKIFTIDDVSKEKLNGIKARMGYVSEALAVRSAISVLDMLLEHREKGFSELVVRHPKSKKEKELVIEALERMDRL